VATCEHPAESHLDGGRVARACQGALAFLSAAVPFAVALSRAASSGQWRDDLPAVRDLGFVAVGVGGGLSTLATQAMSLLPLGPRAFRAALVSALAMALACKMLFALVQRTLAAASSSRKPNATLAAVLGAIATMTAGLSPSWQREATVGGSAMLATAATLALVTAALRCFEEERRDALGEKRWLLIGGLTGATFAESPAAALSAVAVILAMVAARSFDAPNGRPARLPGLRIVYGALALGLVTAALLLAPLALRPIAPRGIADVGRSLSATSLSALDVDATRASALVAWTHEIGLVSLGIAAAGALIALTKRTTRVLLAPLLALVAIDTLLPARTAGILSADPLTAVRALAIAAITTSSALGVHEVVAALLRARIPFARSGAVLVVVFHLTLVALTTEESGFAADRSEQMLAEAWTDESLERLPPSSAVLIRSPALAWRLWAAQLVRGQRPDVVVVPIPLLDRGRVARTLLTQGREFEPLVRDFAISGRPSEFALSTVADVHPLHVEMDRTWSKRLVTHLMAFGLWLEYAPQPLGPSDRKSRSAAALVSMERLIGLWSKSAVSDPSTAAVLTETMRGHASVFSTLGDHAVADAFTDRVVALAAHEPLANQRALPYALKGIRRAAARHRDERPKKR
jgi:hypothetical protein